jgi:hypothetical protein
MLPPKQDAAGMYAKCIRDGDYIHTTTHFGQEAHKTVRGKVGAAAGATITPARAKELARSSGLRLLATLSHFLGEK